MPQNHAREDGHLNRSVKTDSKSRHTYHFSDGADVQRYLQIQKQDTLSEGELSSLCIEANIADYLSHFSPYCTSQPAYRKIW